MRDLNHCQNDCRFTMAGNLTVIVQYIYQNQKTEQ
jgi:hypothetical protein